MTPLSWSTVNASYDSELSSDLDCNVLSSDTAFSLGEANTICLYYNWTHGCDRVHHRLMEEDEGTEQHATDSHLEMS